MRCWFEPNHIKLPQIDVVAYLTQYIWTLISLLLLFSFIVLTLLPRVQQQLALRGQTEVNFEDCIISVEGQFQTGVIEIFKILLNLDYDNLL